MKHFIRFATTSLKQMLLKPKKVTQQFKIVLNYIEQWLFSQRLIRGEFATIPKAFQVLGFNEDSTQQVLLKNDLLTHGAKEICFCSKCNWSTLSEDYDVTTIKQNILTVVERENAIKTPLNLLCGQEYTGMATCYQCQNERMFHFEYRTPAEILVVATRSGFHQDFECEELTSIPLIDSEQNVHQYQCSKFIIFKPNHFILHLIDWKQKILWECDTLAPSKLKRLKWEQLAKLITTTACIFLEKNPKAPAKYENKFVKTQTSLKTHEIFLYSQQDLQQALKSRHLMGISKKYIMNYKISSKRKMTAVLVHWLTQGFEDLWIQNKGNQMELSNVYNMMTQWIDAASNLEKKQQQTDVHKFQLPVEDVKSENDEDSTDEDDDLKITQPIMKTKKNLKRKIKLEKSVYEPTEKKQKEMPK